MKGIKDTSLVRKKVGERLEAARKGKGLSRPGFASLLLQHCKAPTESNVCADPNLMAARLKQWEYGNNPIELEWIPAICDILKCDTGYLFGEYEALQHSVADVCQETGLSKEAVKRLQQLAKVSNGARPGAGAKGYIIETVEVLSRLIESDLFFEMTGDIAFYLIFGGVLPSKAYSKTETELSKEEYERFYRWANGTNREIMARQDVKEMYLQKASDSLKRICEEMLKNG